MPFYATVEAGCLGPTSHFSS